MSKETYVPALLKLFRKFGYEGVTLTKISQETGLGKASLYHHFPGGKAEMAEAALNQANQWLESSILPILMGAASQEGHSKAALINIFQAMCEETSRFFDGGHNSCLWAGLVLEQSSDALFHAQISEAFSTWIEAIAKILRSAGMDEPLARQRGEDAMISIQGALILSHSLHEFESFQRVLKELPKRLCEGI